MRFTKAHIIVILSFVALAGILIYLNFKTPTQQVAPTQEAETEFEVKAFDYEEYARFSKDSLPEVAKQYIDSLEQVIGADTGNYQAAKMLSYAWDSLGNKLIAANYLTAIATRLGDERSWFSAGLKYYDFASLVDDTAIQIFASKQAITAFEKVIALNPDNVEAKNALAICYVQNDIDVMKGVQLLKDVIRRDSNNLDANYTLGMLSIRSGQLDKAKQRFEKLVKIEPFNAEYYYYLGEVYAKLEMKAEALKTFETCKTLLRDDAAKAEIENIINNIKNIK